MQKNILLILLSGTLPLAGALRSPAKLPEGPGVALQNQAGEHPQLELQISLEKSKVPRDEGLTLRIEIRNVSDQDLFVCKYVTSGACDLIFSFTPLVRAEGGAIAGDCAPYEWSKHASGGQLEYFINVLLEDWIDIPAGDSFGTHVQLDPRVYPELRTPGHYHLSARLSSGGLLEQHCYYKLKEYRSEVGRLRAKPWRGLVASNPVSVNVTDN